MEPKQKHFNVREIAEALGTSAKMPAEEKATFLEAYGKKIFTNYDFVATGTYINIFSSINLEGKNLVIAGAGYPFDGSGASNLTEALSKIQQNVNILPVDILHTRARGWLLVDEDKKEGEKGPDINPLVADATNLPFPDNSISGYVSTNLINEPNKEQGELVFVKNLIEEAFRVLTPGGFLILSSFGYFKYTDKMGPYFITIILMWKKWCPQSLLKNH